MVYELNLILDNHDDPDTGRPYLPCFSGENAFLNHVVIPLYDNVKNEVGFSKGGTKPHSAWRNYDDLNEFFWRRRCLRSLKWPLDLNSNYFYSAGKAKRVKKTGFVEQRSFWKDRKSVV